MLVVGKISVKAICENRKREIKAVYLVKKDKDSRYIESLVPDLCHYVDRETLDKMTQSQSHGGFAVDCEKRFSDELMLLKQGVLSLILLEGISDPYNLGEICRTLWALGFDGIISPVYDFYEHEAKLIRASAGASEHLWWHQSEDLAKTLAQLKAKGVRICATHRQERSVCLEDYPMSERLCFCLGGAYRGLSRTVLDHCDDMIRIDYPKRIALSTVGAASVIAYERMRQRRKGICE